MASQATAAASRHVPEMALLLATGTVLNVIAQVITDRDFADRSTHLIPWVKFASTLAFAATNGGAHARAAYSGRQRRLMALIGLLDASAYTAYCLGFYACGAVLANLVLSAASQLLTALSVTFVLRRPLTRGQAAGVACVAAGLVLRTAPIGGGGKPALELQPGALAGGALVLLAAALYTGVGAAYDALVKSAEAPPPHAAIMWHTSLLGFAASSAYQLLYTLPRLEPLVLGRMRAGGTGVAAAAGLLCLFGAAFNVHMYAQGRVFRSEGVMAVSLVNALRSAAVALVSGVLFCSPERPWLCVDVRTAASVGTITLGGLVWVALGQPAAAAGTKPAAAKKRE